MATVTMDKWATLKMIAPEFSASSTYAVGAWTTYGGVAWKCHTAVSSAGAWTGSANWTEKPLAEMLDAIQADVASLAARYSQIVVTCTTQDDVAVTGQTVTLRAGTTADAPVYDTRAYNGQPVTFEVPRGFRYYVEVSASLAGHFAPTTAAGTATAGTVAVTLTYSDTSHITTFADVKACVNACTTVAEGNAALSGVEIADTWVSDDGVSSYSDPMICQGVQEVQDAAGNTHLAAIMMRKYATMNDIPFDAAESGIEAYATEATATSGLYYWGYGKAYSQTSTYAVNAYCGHNGGIWKCVTAVSAQEAFDSSKWLLMDARFFDSSVSHSPGEYVRSGTNLFLVIDTIPAGGTLTSSNTSPMGNASFQINALAAISLASGASVPHADWAAVYHTDVSGTSKDFFSYGYNNYALSAIDQYLSSGEAAGQWWHPSHVGDCPPAYQLAGVRGYQAGCSAALLEYAKPIRVKIWPWNQQPQYVVRTLWLPSGAEMFADANANEGSAFKRVADSCYAVSGWTGANNGNTNARIFRRVSSTGSAANVRLRSANRSASNYAWYVNTSGGVNYYAASSAFASAPACAIY